METLARGVAGTLTLLLQRHAIAPGRHPGGCVSTGPRRVLLSGLTYAHRFFFPFRFRIQGVAHVPHIGGWRREADLAVAQPSGESS